MSTDTAGRTAANGAGSKLPPTPLERAPVPDLGTALIPKSRYISRAYAEKEHAHLWNRVWLLAGFLRDLPLPGDYLTYEIGRESVLVVRQASGEVAAFHNVCMHRGNRLVEPGRGQSRGFTCLFHAWRYGIDGGLEHVLDEERFEQGCPRQDLEPVARALRHLGRLRLDQPRPRRRSRCANISK